MYCLMITSSTPYEVRIVQVHPFSSPSLFGQVICDEGRACMIRQKQRGRGEWCFLLAPRLGNTDCSWSGDEGRAVHWLMGSCQLEWSNRRLRIFAYGPSSTGGKERRTRAHRVPSNVEQAHPERSPVHSAVSTFFFLARNSKCSTASAGCIISKAQ